MTTERDVLEAQSLYEIAEAQHRLELLRVYGRILDLRHTHFEKGHAGSLLRELYNAREAAKRHFLEVDIEYCGGR